MIQTWTKIYFLRVT